MDQDAIISPQVHHIRGKTPYGTMPIFTVLISINWQKSLNGNSWSWSQGFGARGNIWGPNMRPYLSPSFIFFFLFSCMYFQATRFWCESFPMHCCYYCYWPWNVNKCFHLYRKYRYEQQKKKRGQQKKSAGDFTPRFDCSLFRLFRCFNMQLWVAFWEYNLLHFFILDIFYMQQTGWTWRSLKWGTFWRISINLASLFFSTEYPWSLCFQNWLANSNCFLLYYTNLVPMNSCGMGPILFQGDFLNLAWLNPFECQK